MHDMMNTKTQRTSFLPARLDPSRLLTASAALALSLCTATAYAQPANDEAAAEQPVTQTVNIDGKSGGHTYYGIGMVNSSGTSKLLQDYPKDQQKDILDFLFKPKFGASLQLVKNEIGADNNTSSGTEPSHWRQPSEPAVARGVNFWISREAKRRNPDMQFAALRWAGPRWTYNDEGITKYLLKYLDLMIENGTPIDFIGVGINEANYRPELGAYIKNIFKPALDEGGYDTHILLADDVHPQWTAAEAIANDPELKAALFGQSAHYTDASPKIAQDSGMPLLNTESDTTMLHWGRGIWVARRIATCLSTGKQGMWLYQPALDCVYRNIRYQNKGILTANTPWSGHYKIHPGLWLTAQFTQFADVGWTILDSGSGAVDRDNAYVTFKDSDSDDYSIVIVNGGTHEVTYTFNIENVSDKPLNVWVSNQITQFDNRPAIKPDNGSFTVIVPAESVYSLTTTTGQQKGVPTHEVPSDSFLNLPYTDDFSDYSIGDQARFFHDQNGAFEIVKDGMGAQALQQVIDQKPGYWWYGNHQQAFTVMGSLKMANYKASADVMIPEETDTATVMARLSQIEPMQRAGTQPEGYAIRLRGDGRWRLTKSTGAVVSTLAEGTIAGFSNDQWHNLMITADKTVITGYVDGEPVATATDDTFATGNVALGTGTPEEESWAQIMFKNLKIEAIEETPVAFVEKMDDSVDHGFIYSPRGWESTTTTKVYTNFTDFRRSRTTSTEPGATLQVDFHGSQFSLVGVKHEKGGTADVYIDGKYQTTIDTSAPQTRNRNVLYGVYDLPSGPHTFALIVRSGTVIVDLAEAESF